MLKTPPRLGLREARHERGTGTLVDVRDERNVWAVEGGSERRTPHAVTLAACKYCMEPRGDFGSGDEGVESENRQSVESDFWY